MSHPKFISYYIEKFGGYALAAIVTIAAFQLVDFSKIKINDLFFDKLVDFSGIIFGFLITVLTLLVQANNSTINILKKTARFQDLIFFNKEIVIISAVICVYTLFILAFRSNVHLAYNMEIKKYGCLILIFLIVLMVSKTYSFLRVFYRIIKDEGVSQPPETP